MGGYRFRLYAKDGDDFDVREFSEPNWDVGDTVALPDRTFRVYNVVYLDEDGEVLTVVVMQVRPLVIRVPAVSAPRPRGVRR